MVVLMSALGGLYWAAAGFSLVAGFATNALKSHLSFWILVLAASAVGGVVVATLHLVWAVRFAYAMDVRRERQHGASTYSFLPGDPGTMPAILRPVHWLSAQIEKRYKMSHG